MASTKDRAYRGISLLDSIRHGACYCESRKGIALPYQIRCITKSMSSFIAQPETYGRIYSGLRIFGGSHLPNWERTHRHVSRMMYMPEVKKYIDTTDWDNFAAIVCALYEMNAIATGERYGEANDTKLPAPRIALKLNADINKYAFLKSLECVQYQCAEGDVPQSDLYKSLGTLIDCVCRDIISSAPEYQMAKWG